MKTNLRNVHARAQSIAGRSKSQAGFTLVEIVVVLAILGLIVLVMSSGVFQTQEDSKVQAAQLQLTKDFPSAITRVVTMTNRCNNTTITSAKLIARGAPAQTVFGSDWSVSTAGNNSVTITYPLDVQDAELGQMLGTALSDAPNIKSATGSATQVVVTYRCN